jgi:hypothetical protein
MTELGLGTYSEEALATLAAHAAELRTLTVEDARWFEAPVARSLDLRRLTTFRSFCGYDLQDFSWWNGFAALRNLRVEPFTGHTLEALARAPWCDRLESVELANCFDPGGVAWRSFWQGRTVRWKSLRLGGCGWSLRTLLEEGKLPGLERLQLRPLFFVKGEFASVLAEASLPALKELEVRSDEMTSDEVLRFLKAPRTGLPSLERLYVTLPSDRRDGNDDGWYDNSTPKYFPLTPDEFEEQYLKPYGLSALRID